MDDSPAGAPRSGLGISSAWVLSGTLVAGLASTGVLLILAGLLGPAEFGHVTVAVLIFEGACVGLSPGLAQAFHALGGESRHARAALTLALVLGGLVTALGMPIAPLAARALGVPEAGALAAAALVAVPARRWNEVRIAQFERGRTFSRPNVVIGASALSAGSLAVAAATQGAGAWALLLYLVASEVIASVVLSVSGPRPVSPKWERESIREVLHYSKRLVGDSLAVYGYTNLDDAVVARLAGPASLGAYNFAYRLANLAALATARPAQRVLLPALRAHWADRPEVRRLYLRSLEWLALLSALVCAAVAFLGPAALELVYDDRWQASYAPLRIFAAYAAFRAIGALAGTIFLAAQQPGFVMKIATWQLAGLTILILPATLRYGHLGAAAAVTAPLAVGVTFAVTRAARLVGVGTGEVIRIVAARWALAVVIGMLAWLPVDMFGGWAGLGAGAGILFAAVVAVGIHGRRRMRAAAGSGSR